MAMSDGDETAALRQRFPRPSPPAAALQAMSILGTNGWLLLLLLRGAASPTAFALYGVIELILLSLVSNLAMFGIPVRLRVGSPDLPLAQRLVAISAISAVLFAIAWASVPDRGHFDRLFESASPWRVLGELQILRPLLLSQVLMVAGALGDRLRWRQDGGPFVNGVALSATPKFLNAIVAPIAAAMLVALLVPPGNAHRALAWSGVYLAIKCGLELLVLAWQCLGMPERKPDGERTSARR